jgi:hypothetical protein
MAMPRKIFSIPFAGVVLIGLGLFIASRPGFFWLGSACNIFGIGVLLYRSGAKRWGVYILLISLAALATGLYFETNLMG